MELRHLRHFLAVAKEGHITRAADRLGMQQPPLSQSIRALENELGVQLFRRKPRGVALTEAGQTLLTDARAILAHVERARTATQRTARGEQGRVSVGFTSSAPFLPFVPRVIRSFRDAHPLVSVNLEEGGTAELTDALRDERIDVAFIRTPLTDASGLAVHELLTEPMVVAVPAAHALAQGASALELGALAEETFIVYRRPSGPGLYDTIFAACHAAGFSPKVGQEAPRIVATLNLVAAGVGVAIVPRSLQRMQLDDIAYRDVEGAPQLLAPLLLASRRGDPSQAVRRLVALVRSSARVPP
jgi:DNA-binding transcriptional LysR family regulator